MPLLRPGQNTVTIKEVLLDILIAGRSKEELKILEEMLGQQGSDSVRTRHVSNGHTDPLYDLTP